VLAPPTTKVKAPRRRSLPHQTVYHLRASAPIDVHLRDTCTACPASSVLRCRPALPQSWSTKRKRRSSELRLSSASDPPRSPPCSSPQLRLDVRVDVRLEQQGDLGGGGGRWAAARRGASRGGAQLHLHVRLDVRLGQGDRAAAGDGRRRRAAAGGGRRLIVELHEAELLSSTSTSPTSSRATARRRRAAAGGERRLVVELLVELRVGHCADEIVGERNGGSGRRHGRGIGGGGSAGGGSGRSVVTAGSHGRRAAKERSYKCKQKVLELRLSLVFRCVCNMQLLPLRLLRSLLLAVNSTRVHIFE